MTRALDLPTSTGSYHLRLLREAGVTRTRAEGTQRLISLRRDDLEDRFPGLVDVLTHSGQLVGPPVAPTLHVVARILAEIRRAEDEDLEALRPGLVASPRAGRDAHHVPLLDLDDLVVELHPPAPRTTTYSSSCSLCVWPYGKR